MRLILCVWRITNSRFITVLYSQQFLNRFDAAEVREIFGASPTDVRKKGFFPNQSGSCVVLVW